MVRTFRLETTEKHTGSSAIECSYIRTRTCALDDDDDDSFYYTFPLIALSQSSSRVSPIVDRHDIRYDLIKRTVSSPRKLVSSSHGVSFNVATSLFVRLYEVSIGRIGLLLFSESCFAPGICLVRFETECSTESLDSVASCDERNRCDRGKLLGKHDQR